MGRKIPWATSEPSQKPAPAKKIIPSTTITGSDTDSPSPTKPNPPFSPSVKSLKRPARTPSTSPPPAPPPQSPMRPGYSNDDLYIMVEDEFASMAQTFTAHLHHAEYQRLKKAAKEKGKSNLWTVGEGMRKERKMMVEGQNLKVRQAEMLRGFGNFAGRDEGEEEEEEDGPWVGTSLAALMGDNAMRKRRREKGKTALVGLEKVQSNTRAARGFKRGFGQSPANEKEVDVGGSGSKRRIRDLKGSVNEGEDPGDLSGEWTRPTTSKAKSRASIPSNEASKSFSALSRSKREREESPSYESNHSTRSRHGESAKVSTTSKSARLEPDWPPAATSKPASTALATWRDRKSKRPKERKMQMHDIPTFLV